MDVVGDTQADTAMPTGSVKHEHNLLAGSHVNLAGELGELDLKERNVDCRGQVKDGSTRRRMHEADEVAPLVAMLDWGERTLAVEAPDLMQDRLQPNAVFVDCPEFDLRVGEGGGNRTEEGSEVF